MNKNTKTTIIILLLIILVSCIYFIIFVNKNKKDDTKTNDYISVVLQTENGDIEVDEFPKNDGKYIFDKIKCNDLDKTNTIKYSWDNENWALKINSSSSSFVDGSFECQVYFKEATTAFFNVIKKNNSINKTPSKIKEEIATLDEGLVEGSIDEYGKNFYYFRGAVDDNYVKFNGFIWRIVRINGDNTVKIVLDKTLNLNSNWTDKNLNEYNEKDVSFKNSNIYSKLNDWYNENITSEDLISDTKFCDNLEYKIVDDKHVFNFSVNSSCNEESIFKSKIGILSINDILYAGGSLEQTNSEFYLVNEENKNWWTLSVSDYVKNTKDINVYSFDTENNVINPISGRNELYIRPVVSINVNAEVSGSGTIKDPYVIK